MKLRAPRVLLLAALLPACTTTNEIADLANNEILYKDVAFATKAPGDRAIFVAPLLDVRDQTVLPTRERGFPIAYGGDDFWERPVRDMVGDVLVRQIQNSGLFAAVSTQASPQTLVLKPTLVSFTTGATEAMSGQCSFAEVGLKLQVLGVADASGKRAVLHEQLYGNRQVSDADLHPVSPYRLVGRALQLSIGKALAGLDGSNVGRSSVPLDTEIVEPAAPAAAASPAPAK